MAQRFRMAKDEVVLIRNTFKIAGLDIPENGWY
jgi:hypothetical protein